MKRDNMTVLTCKTHVLIQRRSSGTTGDPKGIVIDFRVMLINLIFQDNHFDVPNLPEQTFLLTSNMFHEAAFVFILLHGLR